MTVIQRFRSFIIGETSSKYGMNTTPLKGITKDNVLTGLILNTTTIYTRNIMPESLGLEIYDNVSIPYVVKTDEKERFVRKGIFFHNLCFSRGKVTYQFKKKPKTSLNWHTQIPI
jgi:hypothetical protein